MEIERTVCRICQSSEWQIVKRDLGRFTSGSGHKPVYRFSSIDNIEFYCACCGRKAISKQSLKLRAEIVSATIGTSSLKRVNN
jgi:hypothetical protein